MGAILERLELWDDESMSDAPPPFETVTYRRQKMLDLVGSVVVGVVDEGRLAWSFWMTLETLFWPPWVSVNRQGLRVKDGFSRRFYPWRIIERIELGNRAQPDHAYLVLKRSLDPTDVRRGEVVELPWLVEPSPEELVEKLEEARRCFQRS